MELSIVVPLFNQLSASMSMLQTLRQTIPVGCSYEVILVDDASTDGTRGWLSSLEAKEIKIVRNPRNLGYAASMNAGVEIAVGKILCLGNSDLVFTQNWYEPMFELLSDKSLNAGIVGNLQYRISDGSLDHAGMTLDLRGKLVHLKDEDFVGRRGREVMAVTGACCLMWRDDFSSVGGFDARYINGGEDVDLCFRLSARGLSTWVSGRSRVGHHVGLSRGTVVTLQAERNSQTLYSSWRQKIVTELSAVWLVALEESRGAAVRSICDCELTDAMTHFPNGAATLLAEHRVNLEFSRWNSLFSKQTNSAVLYSEAFGFARHPSGGIELARSAKVEFSGGEMPRNVVLRGSVINRGDSLSGPARLSIEVNGALQKESLQTPGVLFDLEILEPIWWEDAPNVIRFSLDSNAESTGVVIVVFELFLGPDKVEFDNFNA